MALDNYSFFVEDVDNDKLWSDNGNTQYQGAVVASLPSINSQYFIMPDPNGIRDLCKQLDSGNVDNGYFMQFKRLNGTFYINYPSIFVGGHPDTRP